MRIIVINLFIYNDSAT